MILFLNASAHQEHSSMEMTVLNAPTVNFITMEVVSVPKELSTMELHVLVKLPTVALPFQILTGTESAVFAYQDSLQATVDAIVKVS